MMARSYPDAETWALIDSHPEYAVSSHGRVIRWSDGHGTWHGRLLRQSSVYGYKYVYLCVGGKVTAKRVNRLVCAAFNGSPPKPSYHAAHEDGVRDNNHFSNLVWKSASQNMKDKERHGTVPFGPKNGAVLWPDKLARGARNGKYTKPEKTPRGTSHGGCKLTEDQVFEIKNDSRPQRFLANKFGVSKGAIGAIKSGKTWRHLSGD